MPAPHLTRAVQLYQDRHVAIDDHATRVAGEQVTDPELEVVAAVAMTPRSSSQDDTDE